MVAFKLAENTPNAPKFFGPICLPKPKSLGFSKKNSLWVSVVRVLCCDSKSVTSEVIIIVSPIKSSLECVTQFSLCSGESFAKFFCCCRTNLLLQLLAHCHCRGCLDMCPFGSTMCVGINFGGALLFSLTTDAQRGNSLHCTAENPLPHPNFGYGRKHILSATSVQFFRYL